MIAKQLELLFVNGLLTGRSPRVITIDPRRRAAVAADEFARTWPGLALIIDVPEGQPLIALDGAEPVLVSGEFTGERVRSLLYRSYGVESVVEGAGRYDTLDSAGRPKPKKSARD